MLMLFYLILVFIFIYFPLSDNNLFKLKLLLLTSLLFLIIIFRFLVSFFPPFFQFLHHERKKRSQCSSLPNNQQNIFLFIITFLWSMNFKIQLIFETKTWFRLFVILFELRLRNTHGLQAKLFTRPHIRNV